MQRAQVQHAQVQREQVQHERDQYVRAKVKEQASAKVSLQGRLEPSVELASDAAGDGQLHVGQQQLWVLLFSLVELSPQVLVLGLFL